MLANITVSLSAAGLLDCLTPLDLMREMPSKEKFSPSSGVQTSDKVVGFEAYKLAVLISIAAAVLSLCL